MLVPALEWAAAAWRASFVEQLAQKLNYKRVALACLAALAEETAAHDKTRAQLQALRDELSRYTRAQVRRA